MKIDYYRNCFVAIGYYEDKELFKAAGFKWNNVRRAWTTTDKEIAQRLKGADWTRRAIEHISYQEAVAQHSYELSWAAATDFMFPAPPGLAGLPYQQAGVEYALMRKDTLIADQPGLGKTIQAIGVLNADESVKTALIVVPASLKINWFREINRWMMPDLTFGIAEATRVDRIPVGVYGSGAKKGKIKYKNVETPDFWPNTDIVVINFDILQRFEDHIKSRSWDLLVCDECHSLKSEESQRTLFLLGGRKDPTKKDRDKARAEGKRAQTEWFQAVDANRRIFLSGTPMMSRPVELWPLVKAFDPQGLGKSYNDFVYRYCGAYYTNHGLDVSGATNLEELGARLRSAFMVRRLKKEVLPELPLKRRVVVPLDSPEIRALVAREDELAQALRLYENMASGMTLDQAEAAQGDQIVEYMTRIGYRSDEEDFNPDKPSWRTLNLSYAAAVSGLEPPAVAVMFEEIATIRRELGLAKLSTVVPWVRDFLGGGDKLILFAYHSDVVKALAEQLADFNPAVIWGGTAVMKRQAQVDKFQEDDTCRLFIGNIHAAGVGITLTRAADVAFAEGDWVPAMIEQCEDRACRIGQTAEKIMSYFLVANGSLDARIAQASKDKEENITLAIG